MRSFVYILISLIIPAFADAQTTISGKVTDQKQQPLPGVNVYIKGTVDGGTSDVNGGFSFVTEVVGKQTLIASMIGMESFSVEIEISKSPFNIDISLKESISELNAVEITAGSFSAGDVNKSAVLRSIDVATTAGATADIFGALQTLPGTLPAMEESGLFVRGGDASESKTFFDGILVNKAFTSDLPDISQRGRFSPFMFKGTSFSTGAYSAQHGLALSSTMMMESKDLAPKTKSELGIMSVGLNAEHAQRFKNSSLEVNGSYYNLKPVFAIVKQNTRWSHEPESVQGNAFYKLKTSKTGMLKIYGCYEQSRTGLITYNHEDVARDSRYDIRSKNIYLNSTWSQFLGDRWKVFVGAGYGDDRSDITIDTNAVGLYDLSFHGRTMVTRFFGKLSDVKFGVDYFRFQNEESYNNLIRDLENPILAGFVETNLFVGNALAFRPGVRVEKSELSGEFKIAPRLSLAYQLNGNAQLSAGYGIYYQMPVDEYLFESASLGFEKATHAVLNYQFRKNKRTFRAEAFYKVYDQLVKESPVLNNTGEGYSQGIDLFYRDSKTFRYADFWVTYSLLDTKRDYRDYPAKATPTFAAKHVVNVVGKYFISEWSTSIGATYTFASGRSYYNPGNVTFLGDRTKAFHNFSCNVSYLTRLGKKFTIIYLSVENVFGIKNVYGYRYSADQTIRKPITPSAPRNIFIGIFITIGDDNPLNL